MVGGAAAALGAGRQRRHADARQPDGGGPLPRQARVRPGPLCLGGPALHGRARGAGLLGDGGPDAVLGREPHRRDARRPVLRLRRAGPVGLFQHHLPGGGGVAAAGLPGGRPLAAAGPAIGAWWSWPWSWRCRSWAATRRRPTSPCSAPSAMPSAWRGRRPVRRPGPAAWALGLAAVAVGWIWAGPASRRRSTAGRWTGAGHPGRRPGPSASWPTWRAGRGHRAPARGDAPGPGGGRRPGPAAGGGAGAAGARAHRARASDGRGPARRTSTIPACSPTASSSGSGPMSSAPSRPGTATGCRSCPRPGRIAPRRCRSTSARLPMVLALGAAGFRGGPPWRAWMTAVALLSFWASLGEFAGPSGWSAGRPAGCRRRHGRRRQLLRPADDGAARAAALPLPVQAAGLDGPGPLGPGRARLGPVRGRASAADGRSPSAIGLLVPTILGLAAAAAMRGRLAAAIAAPGVRPRRLRAARRLGGGRRGRAGPGPRGDRPGGEPGVLVWSAGRRRAAAAAMALALLTADLAVANAPLVIAIPQADFEREPEVLRGHPRGRTRRPQPGPVPHPAAARPGSRSAGPSSPSQRPAPRAGRLGDRHAPAQLRLAPRDRLCLRGRERDGERSTQRRLFRPAYRALDPGLSAALGVEPGRPVLYHPRGAFDLWGARYFIIPSYPGDWTARIAATPRSSTRPT